MPDPMHFDRLADVYDRARPPYPDALWRRLGDLGLLVPGRRAVDLGAGSGQATRVLVEAGLDVVAVEPGPALAARLRRAVPAAGVIEATAEAAPLVAASFDLATAATAVHWFDLGVVLPRLHRALVPGGRLAVWRNVFGDMEAPQTPFRERVAQIVAQRDAPPRPGPGESETATWTGALSVGGWFAASHVEEFRWRITLDAEDVRGLFTTFSDWTPEEASQAAAAVRDLGGAVTEHYVTPLIVLDRT
ncbi:class I SAM-dependent methyltransferase [Leifsonia virtsii]|uniref:Class I SAM-dependent methyltransferase n=1 Tax=Leifsonia virtsii TaxID=3035915 RepID=A0ABT8ITN4_9MICO|nr:class I SAM-dependent methyltransferase [Leifsonia virtsii]MDN4596179.1 class I SAM-dependent methyltransferase [Leifsonia virtsii]